MWNICGRNRNVWIGPIVEIQRSDDVMVLAAVVRYRLLRYPSFIYDYHNYKRTKNMLLREYWVSIKFYSIFPLIQLVGVNVSLNSQSTITPEEELHIFLIIPQLIVTFVLLGTTLMEIRTSYVFVIHLIPLCISELINYTIFRNGKSNYQIIFSFIEWRRVFIISLISVGSRILVYMICNSVPFFYLTYLAVPLFQLLIPMMGRMGAGANTEIMMCFMCQIVVLGLFLYFVSNGIS